MLGVDMRQKHRLDLFGHITRGAQRGERPARRRDERGMRAAIDHEERPPGVDEVAATGW